ncbi:MAG: glycosyl hydrolase [Gilvibacter sp.]
MILQRFLTILFIGASTIMVAQPAASSKAEQEAGISDKDALTQASLVKNIAFTNIGPSIMSGRVVDFAVNPADPTEFYVGYASGGVWHTNNNGTTFTPVMDNSPTQNVGDIAVDWNSGTIWVGTGEVNASRSSYAGIGLLKSTDKGASWTNMGLSDSHHISRILLNPNNPDEVVVSSVGHLYSKNDERGIYRSTDGGKTWSKTLFVNDQTGIIDLAVDPNNFNNMYAGAWDKDRKAWNFTGNGNGSGIYKSTDAGVTWTKVSTPSSGFPTGEGVGRIGLTVVDANTVYAIHDNQFRREGTGNRGGSGRLQKDDFKTMTKEALLALDDNKLNGFLRQNGFQQKYQAANVKQMVRSGSLQPKDIANYLEDANSLLFDTPVVGAEVYKSTNGGKTWKKTHEGYLDDLYYSYGYYFGMIHVDPSDENGIYIYGVPILKSKDGGKTFSSINGHNVHADHHALWINPNRPGHLINGNDGGINISYDDGASWIKNNSPSVGQFYAIQVDNETPYNVYGGLQDNGVWKGPSDHIERARWHQTGEYGYKSIMGGDGMQIQVDNRNTDVVYTGFQFGNYFRLNLETSDQKYIQPKHELGERPYRFNWQTPILLSSHNQDILYLGGNKLMRSMNQGDDWDAISGDLTKGGKVGNVAYGTITTISESPFEFGLLYTGSDDGLIQMTRNSGGNWNNTSSGLPQDLWVSRVEASSHKKARVYATLNGYRWDDFKPYVYVSEDFGVTWKSISSNLPASPVNVIKEDPENMNILYLGTDNGAYVSLDRGSSWQVFSNGVPNVAVHDLIIHPRDKDLILGTHGRSIYKANVAMLQQMDQAAMNKVVVSKPNSMSYSRRWGSSFSSWFPAFEPSMDIKFYSPVGGKATATILSPDGKEINQMSATITKGFNNMPYDVSMTEKGKKAMLSGPSKIGINKAQNGVYYLPVGTYTIKINVGGQEGTTTLEIK